MSKLPTIDIKGKEYVLVSERVLAFNEMYPEGSIVTELISAPADKLVVIKATVRPHCNSPRCFTGYSQATWGDGYINKTSALENAETSAVGRALGFMGIGVVASIASADEMHKAGETAQQQGAKPTAAVSAPKKGIPIGAKSLSALQAYFSMHPDEQEAALKPFGKMSLADLSEPQAHILLNKISEAALTLRLREANGEVEPKNEFDF